MSTPCAHLNYRPRHAAVEACRRLQVAEAEIRRLRALDDSDG